MIPLQVQDSKVQVCCFFTELNSKSHSEPLSVAGPLSQYGQIVPVLPVFGGQMDVNVRSDRCKTGDLVKSALEFHGVLL